MKAIMTAFATGENRSILNPPFRFGKARVAPHMQALRQPFHPGKRARRRIAVGADRGRGVRRGHAGAAAGRASVPRDPVASGIHPDAARCVGERRSDAGARRSARGQCRRVRGRDAAARGVTRVAHGAAEGDLDRANGTAPLDGSKRGRLNTGAAYASDSARYGFVHPPYLAAGF
jgi:hypothetical protein